MLSISADFGIIIVHRGAAEAAVDVTGIENARVSTRTASTFSPSASAKPPIAAKFSHLDRSRGARV